MQIWEGASEVERKAKPIHHPFGASTSLLCDGNLGPASDTSLLRSGRQVKSARVHALTIIDDTISRGDFGLLLSSRRGKFAMMLAPI